ncbi:alpha-N-arabinofuranosidase [Emericellopsis cladophorae]|uniref:Alpha-N-arabinofuranosidase n=1 Tax=Emericellopsis cladophorae TaxID=2686198 RepID=A0A9P9Y3A1_9HYPO|nr:alpha-N-arabinofuranosidase [Emericellopsis cladophorae]KAI6782818.1 alpha-N-arabinofuranosidase [Emericellopsis cladophorae]
MRPFSLLRSLVGYLGLAGSAIVFSNPIRAPGGADPHGLKTATARVIYTDSNPSRCRNVWAPELHHLSGRWYFDGTNVRFNGLGNYFFYSGITGVPHQSACVHRLGTDSIEVPVREGQDAPYIGGKTYVAYSANCY